LEECFDRLTWKLPGKCCGPEFVRYVIKAGSRQASAKKERKNEQKNGQSLH
jgi:hypothetical protein